MRGDFDEDELDDMPDTAASDALLEAAEQRERAMARGFMALWDSEGVQDADDWLYDLLARARVLTASMEDK